MKVPFEKIDEGHIQQCLESHLDPENGTPFWLEKAKEYGGIEKARDYIDTWKDLKEVFGLNTVEKKEEFADALRTRPYWDFVPDSTRSQIYLIGESGGTTGSAKRAAYSERDWQAYVDNTNAILDEIGFPRGVDWLWVGPPHPPHGLGAFPEDLAKSRDGQLYGIDLDPRIMKKFGREGKHEALERYRKHIMEQVAPIIQTQDVGVIFSTAKVLKSLPKAVDISELNFDGVIHGGTPVSSETYRQFREEIYEAPLTGFMGSGHTGPHGIQVPETENYEVVYLPNQPKMNLEVIDINTGEPVKYGQKGRVVTSKITEDFLMPAFLEEVEATKAEPPKSLEGVSWPCVKDIQPKESRKEKEKGGVY